MQEFDNEAIKQFIISKKWTWAKTYAKFAPHWWLFDKEKEYLFKELVKKIFAEGVIEKFKSKEYRVLYFGNYKYWVMDSEPELVTLVNRTLIDETKLKEIQKNYLASIGEK